MPEESGERNGSYWRRLRSQKEQILNVRAEAARRENPLQRAISTTARRVARPAFFAAELVLHVAWIGINTLAPASFRFDPYPYPLLMGLASVQALFIGLLILMYEERSAQVAEIREETELQVNLHTERETTKLLRMLAEVHQALGIRSAEHDAEFREMAEPLDPGQLREDTEKEIREVEDRGIGPSLADGAKQEEERG